MGVEMHRVMLLNAIRYDTDLAAVHHKRPRNPGTPAAGCRQQNSPRAARASQACKYALLRRDITVGSGPVRAVGARRHQHAGGVTSAKPLSHGNRERFQNLDIPSPTPAAARFTLLHSTLSCRASFLPVFFTQQGPRSHQHSRTRWITPGPSLRYHPAVLPRRERMRRGHDAGHLTMRLVHSALALVALLSTLTAAQFPSTSVNLTTITSPVDGNVTIRYKIPDGACKTAYDSQQQYTGWVSVPGPFPANMFFWFIGAREPTNAMTIWLNGGPGVSSLFGMFTEVGPCEVIEKGLDQYETVAREWGWDRASNMLFIDQVLPLLPRGRSVRTLVLTMHSLTKSASRTTLRPTALWTFSMRTSQARRSRSPEASRPRPSSTEPSVL